MANKKVIAGDALKPGLLLTNGNITKGVRVHILDESNAPVTGSPFNLPHVTEGWYSDDTLVTQASDAGKRFTGIYIVFEDNTYAAIDSNFPRDEDTFEIDVSVNSRESDADASTRFDGTNDNIDSETSQAV